MANVNPPANLRTPRQFDNDPEALKYFRDLEFIMFQMWKRTGGGEDMIAESSQFSTSNQAALNEINLRLGSGDALTSDETGFTVDSTNLSVDMTEA